jgi:hypothetical protein
MSISALQKLAVTKPDNITKRKKPVLNPENLSKLDIFKHIEKRFDGDYRQLLRLIWHSFLSSLV